MADISGPYTDDSGQVREYRRDQSVSTFRRVKLVQWKLQNGITITAMEQFQIEPTFDKTIIEIKKQQPKLFNKTTTKCLIYRDIDPKTIIENDTGYQFWLMQNPTVLYFQNIQSKSDQSGCCIIL
mmetsp:Transcript_24899/g.21783  ORF Transcript_24899/g.21783 Transcript_24899/m.21783 type:complete len:125 (+) Transcript_24899:1-375(+)